MKIFIIGGSGLVGSRLTELLGEKYGVDNLSISSGTDITKLETLDIIKNDSEHQMVLLLAAKTNVDQCELDKSLGKDGDAWKTNVQGVQNVVDVCLSSSKKMIYISTDFVFDGEKTPENGYVEEDLPLPINWYGETKYRGEELVRNSGLDYIIARIAYPYRKDFGQKTDFARVIIERLKNNQPVSAIFDHKFTPTFIDDIAVAIDKLIDTKSMGIFHIAGSQTLTPFNAAMLIAEKFGLDNNLISKTSRAEYFKDKAQRPFNVALNNDKIKKLGVNMRGFEEGLDLLK